MKPLLMMRTKGLTGPLFAKHAFSNKLSKSSGNFVGEGGIEYENLIPNSSWQGVSGSVSGADWVFPTGYAGGFWPPTDAIAIPNSPDNQIHIIHFPFSILT